MMIEVRDKLVGFYKAGRIRRVESEVSAQGLCNNNGLRESWISEQETRITNNVQLKNLAQYARLHDIDFGIYYVVDGNYIAVALVEGDEVAQEFSSTEDEMPDVLESPDADQPLG